MAKKKQDGYLSARESRRISRENRKVTNAFEKEAVSFGKVNASFVIRKALGSLRSAI